MWFKQFWGRNKREGSSSSTAATSQRATASAVENPPVKASAAERRDATAGHRQPLGVVSNQIADRHVSL